MRPVLRLVLPILALLLAGGCAKPHTLLVPNLPPETRLFVEGTVDTVNHIVQLYWFGSDPDGEIRGFELRFHNPAQPAETTWTFTTRTDSLFTIFTPTGFTAPVFEVRAVDNTDTRDPTPATADFSFTNQPPGVHFVNPPIAPRDTTYASVTLSWAPTDPDGDVANLSYRVWLDGNEANAVTTTATTFTVPTALFLQGGQLLSGIRKVYVEPIDDGGRVGARDSASWVVRAPVTGSRARLLLIDDVPPSTPGAAITDSLWWNGVARNMPADQYSILRLDRTQPFRSDKDVEQTFALFEAVVWYRGSQIGFPVLINRHQAGIAAYLDGGGQLLLEGLNMIEGRGASGALPESFADRYFGSNFLFKNENPAQPGDSTVAWGVNTAAVLRSSAFQDSLRMLGIFNGLRGFGLRDTSHAVVWARAGALSQPHDFDIPIAVSVPRGSGGRATIVTFPLRIANGYQTAPAFLTKMLQQFGVTGP